MHWKCNWLLGATVFFAGSLWAEDAKPLWLTSDGQQPPRFYLFWQSGWTPKTNPEHINLVSENPPDLFQYPTHELSSGLPHGSMCPAPAKHEIHWWYEKDKPQETPTEAAKPQWWTTEEYSELIARGAAEVKWVMEQTGAYGLVPYVCAIKIEGEKDKRLRFWAFYDHWELYKQWYGPRPQSDPWDWIQFRPDYNAKSMWGFYKPADDGSRIYSGCPNSSFTEYLANLVKIGAQNGLRGVFVDNPTCFCICPNCQKAWQDFLRSRFTKKELKKYFGIDDYADAKLNEKDFEVETKRFWAYSVGRHLARLREAGESVHGKGNFWICPNGAGIEYIPSSRGCDPVEWARLNGFQLGSRENIRMSEGFERRRLTRNLYFNATEDLILGHKMMRGLASSQVWAAPLRSHEFLGNDEAYYNLAAAEMLAFDGCLCDSGATWLPTTARKPFYKFYRTHESLLRSGESIAEVGVLCFTNELFFEPADTIREVRLVTDWLSEAHVLWDAVMDDNLTEKSLAKYKVVFVPNIRMLDDAEVDVLLGYARAGGRLILSGEVGTAYRCGVKRKKPAFAAAAPRSPVKLYAVTSYGKGKIAFCPRGFADVDVPDVYTGTDDRCEQPARSLIRETNRKTFLACLDETAGEGLSAILSEHRALRISARWFIADKKATMTVHLANYDLRMYTADQSYYRVLREPSVLTPATDVKVIVPIPTGYKASAVSWAELPELKMKKLDFVALRDGVRFTIPRVTSYSFAAVALVKADAATAATLAKSRGEHTTAQGVLPAIEVEGKPSDRLTYADESKPPNLDHVLHVAPGNPVIVSGTKGKELEIRLDRPGQEKPDASIWTPMRAFDVSAEAERGAVRWMRFWLITPSGGVAASGAVPAEQSTIIKVSARESGLYALMTEAGLGSLAVSTNGRALMATAQPLRFEDPNARLYFFVPKGVKEFTLTSGGLDEQMHMKVLDSTGALRFQRDDFNVHHKAQKITVPEGQDGKVWLLTFATDTPAAKRAGRRTQIELAPPLPGFVSPDKSRLVLE